MSYTPTPEERKSSSNYSALLARMMVAGLRVDEFSNKVETNWGKEVHFFINGVEAKDWEMKTLRPKEVARVEFLQSPSNQSTGTMNQSSTSCCVSIHMVDMY